MKKWLYMLGIILCTVVFVLTTQKLSEHPYEIPQNVAEIKAFRQMEITLKVVLSAAEFAKKQKMNLAEVLAPYYLSNDFLLKNITPQKDAVKRMKKAYQKADAKEYKKYAKAMAAVWNDLTYFPVAKGSHSPYWVAFEDSFGAERNYNGAYQHEGTDIMAENNVSGYYPVVSVTDGVVENIGWLEKGGYRIGIRAPSGGYFYYAHLSSYAPVQKGDKIKAGTLLGYMGDTGYGKMEGTSGNFAVHLHFGIYIQTENYEELSINPYAALKYLENKLIVANY